MNEAKPCRVCLVVKPLSDFYAHPSAGDLRMNKCKECHKKAVQENYRANLDQYREYEKSRAMLPHRVELRAAYQKTEAGKAAVRRAHEASNSRYPERRQARILTGNAIRDGKIARLPCEVCGNVKAEAHHDDYSKPLDVRWLCRKHHAEHHRMQDQDAA
jgi:hypothetical protein